MSIHQNLKQLRVARGMTQEQVADRLHVTRQSVSSYESGRTKPDIDTLMRLAEVYGVELDAILYGKTEERHDVYFRRSAWGIGIALILLILLCSLLRWLNQMLFPLPEKVALYQTHFFINQVWEKVEGIALALSLIGFLLLTCLELTWKISVSLKQRGVYFGVLAVSLLGPAVLFAALDPVYSSVDYRLTPIIILSRLLFFQLLSLSLSALRHRRHRPTDT